jgi:hypothetical protein
MESRIYTYKITFEGTPFWYWGVHAEKEYNEEYWGSPVTNKWCWDMYTPEKQILEVFPHTDEGWKEANLVEDRLIRPDLNNPLCLNENCGGGYSLELMRKNSYLGGKKAHSKKDALGRSIHGVKAAERLNKEKDEFGRSVQGVKNSERLNKEKDKLGRSVNALKGSQKLNEEKTEHGKSVNAVKGAAVLHTFLHSDKNEEGKSKVAVKAGKSTGSQRWRCLVTGFVSTAAGIVRYQKNHGIDTTLRERIC